MKQKRTYVTLLLVVAVLCLGIAYAAISGVQLEISGSAAAEVGDGTIDVVFTKAEVQDGSKGTVTADVDGSDAKKATINVTGLTTEGDTATVVYTITNNSDDIAATLGTPAVTWTNKTWYNVTCTLSSTDLAKSGTQTATVVVELLKTPVEEKDATAAIDETITITIDAEPVANS